MIFVPLTFIEIPPLLRHAKQMLMYCTDIENVHSNIDAVNNAANNVVSSSSSPRLKTHSLLLLIAFNNHTNKIRCCWFHGPRLPELRFHAVYRAGHTGQ